MLELINNDQPVVRRDPIKTREKLLQSAYQQIHEHGFQTASLDEILRDTGVTKGALYHHFPNKNALGYAVVEEIIAPMLAEFWINPVVDSDDPVVAMQQVIRETGESMSMQELKLGCPLNNLSQEMSATDEGFRLRLDQIYDQWRGALSVALQDGKAKGCVAAHVDPVTTAAFLVASLEGCIGMAKNSQDMNILLQCGQGINDFLETLKGDVKC